MIVTPESFRQQLRILKQFFILLPLSEWIARRAQGKPLPERACAVTFDDGWRDNFEYAFPILQEEQVPATVFAVSHMIGTTRHFWPNRLARLLAEVSPDALREYEWLAPLVHDKAPDKEATANVIAACKQYSDDFLQTQLTLLEEKLAPCAPLDAPLMDWSQLSAMQASGLVDIGSHTCHHCRLVPGLPESVLEREIVESRKHLERHLDRPVTLFCYPNGDASAAAAELVSKHYDAAVTTRRGINVTGTPLQSLLRIGVHEDISNTATRFGARLSGWL